MLVIRMRQQGAKNAQSFRLVVTDIRNPRDGKYVEMIGWYKPFDANEKNLKLDVARLQYWIDNGALLSEGMVSLVKRAAPEVIQQINARKAAKRAKARVARKK